MTNVSSTPTYPHSTSLLLRRMVLSGFWLLAGLSGCAKTTPITGGASVTPGLTAPNPSGCYVKVFDQPQLRGTSDFINGPNRYPSLARLPNGANWNNRIRSLEVGPGATAVAWSHRNLDGASMEIARDAAYRLLPHGFVGDIESLDVRCLNANPQPVATP